MMARTADDDKEAARKMAEPIILEGVASELAKRGLTAATGQPDLTVTYYLLLTSGVNAQYMGQFLSATPEWGLPPFPPATQSFKATNNGALVIDFNAKNDIVWRGVAQAQLDIGIDLKKREAVLREGDQGSDQALSAEVRTPRSSGEGEVMTIRRWQLPLMLAVVLGVAAACSQPPASQQAPAASQAPAPAPQPAAPPPAEPAAAPPAASNAAPGAGAAPTESRRRAGLATFVSPGGPDAGADG